MKKIYFIFLFCAGLQTWANSQCITASNQFFNFPFSNNSNDASSYNQPILNFGSVTYGADRFGNANAALNSSSGTVFLTNDVSGNFKCQFPITFSSWVYLNALNSRNPVFCNEDAATNISGVYVEVLSNGAINVRIGQYPGDIGKNYTTSPVVTTGEWFNLAVVLNSMTDVKIYKNGIEAVGTFSGSATSLGYLFMTGTAAKIGSGVNGTGTNVFLNGLMDDVRFWNVSLQSYQITALYNSHVDALVEDTVTICEGGNADVVFPYTSCDISWSNGDNDSVCNILGSTLGLGTHTVYMSVFDDMNVEYTDSVVVVVQACAGVDERSNTVWAKVYPNPASGKINLNFSENGEYKICLYDLLGNAILKSQCFGNSAELYLESIPAGSYLIEVISNNGSQTQKLTVR